MVRIARYFAAGVLFLCLLISSHQRVESAEIARWAMNEGAGAVAASSIDSPAADALFLGDPRWVKHLLAPVPGNAAAIQLGGDETYLQSNTLNGVQGNNARSMSAWVRTLSGDNLTIFDTGIEGTGTRFTLRTNNTSTQGVLGAIRLEVAGGYAVATKPVNDGQWHHVAVTFPAGGTADDAKLYVDGALDGALSGVPFSSVLDATVNTSPNRIEIGIRNNGQFGFNGVIDEVRFWDEELSASAVAALVPGGPLPTIHFEVDRDTGKISLVNGYGGAINEIVGYSIRSAAGTLNTAAWKSVTDFYDANSGSMSFDSDDQWVELTNTTTPTGKDLSEFTPTGNGGILTTSTPLDLGNGWSQFPVEDLTAELTFVGGDRLPIAVKFIGNGGVPLPFGDLNTSGQIDPGDWVKFRTNLLKKFPGMPTPQAYLLGDLDFDGDNDRQDFVLFETLYDDARGMGAFQGLLAGESAVPEPTSSLVVAILLAFGLALFRSRRPRPILHCASVSSGNPMKSDPRFRNPLGLRAFLIILGTVVCQSANADVVAYYDFESPNPYNDRAGTANGTVTGSTVVTTGAGAIGNAANFGAGVLPVTSNTGDQWVTVPQAQAPNFGIGDISISLWYKRANPQGDVGNSAATGGPDGVYDSLSTTTSGYQLFILETGVVNGRFDEPGAGFMVLNSPAAGLGGIEANTATSFAWHHIVYSLDRTSVTPTANLYVDGVSVGAVASGSLASIVGAGRNIVPSQSLFIGQANEAPADGSIDDLAFFDQALTPQDVQNLYTKTKSPVDFFERLKIEVNTTNGSVALRNNTTSPIEFDYYEILSNSSSLNAANWQSLQSQNLPGFPAGSGNGNGWEAAGGSSDAGVGETYLDGFSTFGGATPPINLGQLFRWQSGMQDLSFVYRDKSTNTFKTGIIEYVMGSGGILGDYNNNGVVDAADYVLWRKGGPLQNEFDTPGTVNDADYAYWRSRFGATTNPGSGLGSGSAVPEPSALWLLAIGAALGISSRCRRSPLLAVVVLGLTSSVLQASVTTDRLYLFGDDILENGTDGQPMGGLTSGFTYDSVGDETTGMMLPGAFIDLQANGGMLYSSQTRPGAPANMVSASFDGMDDYLVGRRLGYPQTSATSTAATLTPPPLEVTGPGPLDYVGISNRGFQLWVNPTTVGGSTQTIVRDTAQHGLAIGTNGHWILRYGGQTIDSNVGAQAGVWAHAMVVRPTLNSGSSLYINGVAVATALGSYTLTDNTALQVGANLSGTTPTEFFAGTLDDMEMFVAGTSTAGRVRYGVFNPRLDNDYIASHVTSTFGDITLDGNFDGADVTAFVNGWLKENKVGSILVGDFNSYQKGDLDFNGIVDIGDAVAFNTAMSGAGMGNLFTMLGDTTVPEPSSAIMVSLTLFMSTVRRPRPQR
jgi:hypothetical protein